MIEAGESSAGVRTEGLEHLPNGADRPDSSPPVRRPGQQHDQHPVPGRVVPDRPDEFSPGRPARLDIELDHVRPAVPQGLCRPARAGRGHRVVPGQPQHPAEGVSGHPLAVRHRHRARAAVPVDVDGQG